MPRLEFTVRRVIFDPLRVTPETVAMMQLRRVPVREPRTLVEFTGGEFTQPVEVRFDMAHSASGR